MSCLVDNFRGITAPPVPGIGAFLECNLYDLEPGSAQVTYHLAAGTRPGSSHGESYRFSGASLTTTLQWPADGKRTRCKMEFLTGRALETVDVTQFILGSSTSSRVAGAFNATILSRPIGSTDPTAPQILQEFSADATLSVGGARWRLVSSSFGELHFAFDNRFVTMSASSIISSWTPSITPAPRLTFEGGSVTGSDIVLRFRKGWTLYNPGYLQVAM